jgi:hypothetical protein
MDTILYAYSLRQAISGFSLDFFFFKLFVPKRVSQCPVYGVHIRNHILFFFYNCFSDLVLKMKNTKGVALMLGLESKGDEAGEKGR